MSPDILNLYYDYTFFDVIFTIILILFSVILTIKIRYSLNLNKNLTLIIFSIHQLMFPLYMFYLFKFGSDSLTYFIGFSGYEYLDIEPGQIFLNKIIIFFNFFEINFYNINYIFSIISLISFYLLLKILSEIKIKDKKSFYILFIFLCLPSIHFWHMGFSKDTISFFCISLIMYEILKSKPNFILIFIYIVLLYFVRIHISLMVFISVIFYYLLKSKNIFLKILFIIPLIFGAQFMLKGIFNFTNIESIFNFLNIFQDLYTENPATALSSDQNFILKMFSYLFVPNILIIKDVNPFYLYIAFENTILILLFLYVFSFKIMSLRNLKNYSFLFIFSIISLIILTYATSNIGIASRQKWMFLPTMYIFFIISKFKYNYK